VLYRKLGSSDLLVSEISLGSWHTFGTGIDKATSIRCIHRALSEGINLIDTANVYGRGAAESVLGEALHTVERSSYILATKVFFPMTEQDSGLSRPQIHKQIDSSLRRLRTDYVDLYQCHRYDWDTPLDETMTALGEIVKQGKVRYIGFSEWPLDKIREAVNLPGVEQFVSSQPQYSMLCRQAEKELFPLCRHFGIANIVWSPLAQGTLTGKYLPDGSVPPNSRADHDYMGKDFNRGFLQREILQAVQELKPLADQERMTLAQFAIAWTLRLPDVASAIIGVTNPDQVTENAAASGARVNPRVFEAVERILGNIRNQADKTASSQ
jgi:aryl-alcohol dehydrogenase-like predicted oxidoreductase